MGTMWNLGEGMDTVIFSLYYMFFSHDWTYLVQGLVVLHILFGIGQYYVLIESPKKQYAEGNYRGLYDSLKYMGDFNGIALQFKAEKLLRHSKTMVAHE